MEMNDRIEVEQVDETDELVNKQKEIINRNRASRFGSAPGQFDYSESRNQQYPNDEPNYSINRGQFDRSGLQGGDNFDYNASRNDEPLRLQVNGL